MKTRLNKYLSELGYCSRREADRLIEAKRILVNDELPEIGQKVDETDTIKIDGVVLENTNEFVYIALYKPIGITSTTDQKDPSNIVDFMNYPKRIFHVGRLDKYSEGLILMTNDGDIVNKILREENNHEKEYIVKVNKPLRRKDLIEMEKGVQILNTFTKPCIINQVDTHTFSIILTEGLNRQIRRMCAVFDYRVLSLKRIRIMNITLDVPKGKWRHLTNEEKTTLFEMLK